MSINVSDSFLSCGINVVSLVYALVVLVLYFVKGKSHKFSSKVFLGFICLTILEGAILIISSVMAANDFKYKLLIGKLAIFTVICWNYMLMFYISIIFKDDERNRKFYSKHPYVSYIIGAIMLIINILGCVFLDIEFTRVDKGYPYLMGGDLYSFASVIAFFSIFYAVVYIIIYRKRLDKLSKVMGIYTVFVSFASMVLKSKQILLINDTLFLHSVAILYLYLSIESQDALLVIEYKNATSKSNEYNKLRGEFIMNMSYQLRTPLTSVLGFSDSLLQEKIDLDNLKEDSKNIYTSSKELLDLINSIIDVSKLESNKEKVNAREYKLDNIIYDISSVINSYISKDNLIFTINADEECDNDLIGDDKKINKILNILLTTSINHTDYGEVSLNISSSKIDSANCELVFHIKNSGHSLSINDFNRTLDDLIKLASDNDTNIDAKTLNLIIAKSLVDLIGGSIEFINESGKGTQFIFKLKQKVTSQNKLGNIREKIQTKHVLSHQILNLSDKKVLVVDSLKLNLEIIQKLLKEYSISIDTSLDPNDALNLFNTNLYDIIFVNDVLGDMSGFEFVEKLNSTGNKVPPVIGLVGKSNEDITNYYDVLELPIEFRNLNMIINKVFEKGEEVSEL